MMVLYLSVVSIDNKLLCYYNFELDKMNIPNRIIDDEWIKT